MTRPTWAEDDLRGYIAELEKQLAEARRIAQNALDRAQKLMDERDAKVSA